MSTEQARHCAQEDETSTAAVSRAPFSKRELGLHPTGVEEYEEQTHPLCERVFDSR